MATLPLPERGQPLSVSYIYQLSQAINDLSRTATYNYTTIDNGSVAKQNVKTSDTKIVGAAVTVSSDSTVTASQSKSFTYTFPSDFKYTPIVTATPINSGKTAAGEDVTVVLTDITRGSVTGFVRYNTNGQVSTIVNLLIIGIPN